MQRKEIEVLRAELLSTKNANALLKKEIVELKSEQEQRRKISEQANDLESQE